MLRWTATKSYVILPRTVGLLIIALLGSVAPQASAQEVGMEVGATQAGYGDALQRPMGLSGTVDLPLSSRISLRLLASHYREARTIRRSPCSGLAPPDRDCSTRRFEGDARLSTVGLGVAVRLTPTAATWRPELYALGTGTAVGAEFATPSGDEQVAPVAPEGLSMGVAVGGSLHYTLTPVVGLTVRVGAQIPRFGTCGADAWFPFCETRVLPEAAVGVRLGRPGRPR